MKLIISSLDQLPECTLQDVSALVRSKPAYRLHQGAIRLDDLDPRSVEANPRFVEYCGRNRLDYAISDSYLADFRLLAIDMDSTLITGECIDELAEMAGKKEEVARITCAAMSDPGRDFKESLRTRVSLLTGMPSSVLQEVFDQRVRLTDGALTLIRAVQQNQTYTVLVSGGFTFFSDRLVAQLQLNAGYANVLKISNGRLTGEVADPILDGAAKAEIVGNLSREMGLSRKEVLVVGDGANDLPMMALSENALAFQARPAISEKARHCVKFGNLRTVIDFFS